MSDPTLNDIQERFMYRDMSGIDGKDVTYLLNYIAELKTEYANAFVDADKYDNQQAEIDRLKAIIKRDSSRPAPPSIAAYTGTPDMILRVDEWLKRWLETCSAEEARVYMAIIEYLQALAGATEGGTGR